NGGERGGLDGVAEAGRKAHGAHHAQLVFGEAAVRRADGADDAGAQVGAPADIVQHFLGNGIEQQAVDGEVAALHVFARIGGVGDFVGMPAVGIQAVAAEGGDFDD